MRKVLLFILLFIFGSASYAQNYQLHSVYIYSFIRYIQWPEAEEGEKFVIGVVGESPLTHHLEVMAETKKAGTQDIVIKTLNTDDPLSACKIIFVSKEAENDLQRLMKKIKGENILLITEKEGLGRLGSNINFVIRNEKLAFELNKSAMEKAALKVSKELVKLAILI